MPILDAVLLSGVQSRMVYHLAELYGQPMTGKRFLEIASGLGTGLVLRAGGTRPDQADSRHGLRPGFGRRRRPGRGVDVCSGQGFLLLLSIGPQGACAEGGRPQTVLSRTVRRGGAAWTKIMSKKAESAEKPVAPSSK